MKFDHRDWKILAFKVGIRSFSEHRPIISDDFDDHLWKVFVIWILNLKKLCVEELI